MTSYNTDGHFCLITHRIALSLPEFFALPLAVPGFIYSVSNAERRQDPWQALDGIRMHSADGGADLSFHGDIKPLVLTAEQFSNYYVYVAADVPVPALEQIALAANAPPHQR